MATVLASTNQGNPSDGNPCPFPSFGNVGAPYMEMLSLPGFTIGFSIWLFSTPMVLNTQTDPQLGSPPPEPYRPLVNLKIDPLPSSHVRSSSYSYSLFGENMQVSNQVDKKKKIRKWATKQLMLLMHLMLRNLPIDLIK